MNSPVGATWLKELSETLARIHEAIVAPIREQSERMRSLLEEMERSMAGLEADAYTLGQWGWTIPMWGEPVLARWLVENADLESIDSFFLHTYSDHDGAQLEEVFSELLSSPALE